MKAQYSVLKAAALALPLLIGEAALANNLRLRCKAIHSDLQVTVAKERSQYVARVRDDYGRIKRRVVSQQYVRDGSGYAAQTRVFYRTTGSLADGGLFIRVVVHKPGNADVEGKGHITIRYDRESHNTALKCDRY